MKRLFHGAIIGIAIGVMIALICSTIFARNEFHPVSPVSAMGEYYFQHLSELQIMFISVIIWSLIGITFSFGDLIFSNSKKPLLFKTSLHFSLMLIIMLPLAILAGWCHLIISGVIFFIMIYDVVYFVIWVIEPKRNQHDINQITDIKSKRKHNGPR